MAARDWRTACPFCSVALTVTAPPGAPRFQITCPRCGNSSPVQVPPAPASVDDVFDAYASLCAQLGVRVGSPVLLSRLGEDPAVRRYKLDYEARIGSKCLLKQALNDLGEFNNSAGGITIKMFKKLEGNGVAPASVAPEKEHSKNPGKASREAPTVSSVVDRIRSQRAQAAGDISEVETKPEVSLMIERAAFHATSGSPQGGTGFIIDADAYQRLVEQQNAAAAGYASFAVCAEEGGQQLYVNASQPFSLVCVGVQGSGKSTTTNVLVEACMSTASESRKQPVALALHYDRADENSFCEMLALTSSPESRVKNIVVFTSVWNYHERSLLLRDLPRCEIRPLLFDFKHLTAKHLMSMMCFGQGTSSTPLYASIVLDVLRSFQRRGSRATLHEFTETLDALELNPTQKLHLNQRLALLKSICRESAENADFHSDQAESTSFRNALSTPGNLVVVDLTNPLITPEDANAIFSVCTDMFTSASAPGGKLLVLDEAHKYISSKLGDLGENLLQMVRQMRHYDLRCILSSQSPETVDAEFFELSSAVLLHHFIFSGL